MSLIYQECSVSLLRLSSTKLPSCSMLNTVLQLASSSAIKSSLVMLPVVIKSSFSGSARKRRLSTKSLSFVTTTRESSLATPMIAESLVRFFVGKSSVWIASSPQRLISTASLRGSWASTMNFMPSPFQSASFAPVSLPKPSLHEGPIPLGLHSPLESLHATFHCSAIPVQSPRGSVNRECKASHGRRQGWKLFAKAKSGHSSCFPTPLAAPLQDGLSL